jgi:hypothetical protein
MILRCAALMLVLVFGVDNVQARPYMPHIEQVPLLRVMGSLEVELAKRPDDYHVRLNLARAYVMVYALNNDEANIHAVKEGGQLSVWTGLKLSYAPSMPVLVSKDPGGTARRYLKKASQLYQQLADNPAANTQVGSAARLGHAWCLEQAGNRQAAIAIYRMLVKETVPDHGAAASALVPGRNWSYAAVEAAGYLMALLSPEHDAAEIAQLARGLQEYGKKPILMTPIAIPLSKETSLAAIEDREARVKFDLDGRNMGYAWSWITPKAGWLAYDAAGGKKIDSGIRLFGSVSYWMFWENGYQALALLDDNRDGMLMGAELAGLLLWVDHNSDGVCDPREARPLAQLGITGLRYQHVALPGHPDRIVYAPSGVQYGDGSSGPSYDIVLHRQSAKTVRK